MTTAATRTIVAGYDGSDPSRDGLALASLLGSLWEAEVVVLSVLTYAPTEATWQVYERLVRDEGERLRAEASAALSGLPNVEVIDACAVSPARELHQLAEARGADLLVLGSTHRGRLGRVMPGTVADRLMAGAPCPLAIAPRGYAAQARELRSIGVADDGSTEARLALRFASELAAAAGAKLELLAVADPYDPLEATDGRETPASQIAMAESLGRGRRQMQADAEAAAASLAVPLEVAARVVEGEPRTALVEASERFDLLAMGSRGYGPLGRVLLGGVSSTVVRDAACPVVVTPRSLSSTAD